MRAAFLAVLFFVSVNFGFSQALSVNDLYQSALDNNQELKVLRGEKDLSLLQIKKAQQERLPKADFKTTLSYIANPPTLDLKPGDLGSMQTPLGNLEFPSEKMSVNLGAQSTNYAFTFIVDQPVFTWGKITNAVSLYRESSVAKNLAIEGKRKELKTKLNIYLYSLRFLSEMEELLSKQTESADRLVYISEQFYKNDIILYNQLLETRMQVNEIGLARTKLESQKEYLLLQLSQICGRDGITAEDLPIATLDTDTSRHPVPKEEDVIAGLKENNPDLKQLDQLKIISSKKLDITKGKALLKPDIGIHLELSYGGPLFPLVEPDWFAQDDYNLTATLGFSASIFDGGRIKTDTASDRGDIEQAFYRYDLALVQMEYAARKAILDMRTALEIAAYYDLKIENQQEQADLLKLQFDAGSTLETDLLSAEIKIYASMMERLSQYQSFFSNYFTIEMLTGK